MDKKSGKIQTFLMILFCIILYVIMQTAIYTHSKIIYFVIFLLALGGIILWEALDWWLLKVMDILLLLYAPLVLLGLNGEVLAEKFGNNGFLMVFLGLAELAAAFSGRIVLVALVVFVYFIPFWWRALRKFMAKIRYGIFPSIHNIEKDGKKIYFQKDYASNSLRLICQKGRWRKVIGHYPTNRETGYSLEWKEKDFITVFQYNLLKHEVIKEERIQISQAVKQKKSET